MIFHAIHRTWVFVKKSCILGRSLPSCSNQTVKCDKSFCLAFLEKHSHRGGRTKCESPHTSRRCPSIGTYGPQLPIDMDQLATEEDTSLSCPNKESVMTGFILIFLAA